MKGIIITTEGKASVKTFTEPLYHALGDAVDGFFEIVRPAGLPSDYVMLVNEDGFGQGKQYNEFASGLCRDVIVGDVVIMKVTATAEGEDFVEFDEDELDYIFEQICFFPCIEEVEENV